MVHSSNINQSIIINFDSVDSTHIRKDRIAMRTDIVTWTKCRAGAAFSIEIQKMRRSNGSLRLPIHVKSY